jgi:hypothetical protein
MADSVIARCTSCGSAPEVAGLDARDGRGRVGYLRVDGDYGLVQPS